MEKCETMRSDAAVTRVCSPAVSFESMARDCWRLVTTGDWREGRLIIRPREASGGPEGARARRSDRVLQCPRKSAFQRFDIIMRRAGTRPHSLPEMMRRVFVRHWATVVLPAVRARPLPACLPRRRLSPSLSPNTTLPKGDRRLARMGRSNLPAMLIDDDDDDVQGKLL